MSMFASLFSIAGGGERPKPYTAPNVEAAEQDGHKVRLVHF